MKEYSIKVAGKTVAEFHRQHIFDACADDMHQNRKEKGISISNKATAHSIDFFDACSGDEKIIADYERMAQEYGAGHRIAIAKTISQIDSTLSSLFMDIDSSKELELTESQKSSIINSISNALQSIRQAKLDMPQAYAR